MKRLKVFSLIFLLLFSQVDLEARAKLSPGAIAGIVIGSIALVALVNKFYKDHKSSSLEKSIEFKKAIGSFTKEHGLVLSK